MSTPTRPRTPGRSAEGGPAPAAGRRRPPRGAAVPRLALLAAGALLAPALGCGDDGPTQPGTLRFGQVGEVRVRVETPLGADLQGGLEQVLVWESSGPWTLTETISYQGRVGDVDVRRSQGNPGTFASAYASLVTLINESPSVRLFEDGPSQDLNPECGPSRSRVTLRVRDESRDEVAQWTRCTAGSLETLAPEAAGPDTPGAVRVIQVAILARDFSLGESFQSVYHGSVPFATLDRGGDSRAPLADPRVFIGFQDREPGDWDAFWIDHRGPDFEPPEVDWTEEMVVVGSVGTRTEAGDSVEVRRILAVDDGTLVELSLRAPGNFCSPAARTHVPFHIVVAPRMSRPVEVVRLPTEFVPCGT